MDLLEALLAPPRLPCRCPSHCTHTPYHAQSKRVHDAKLVAFTQMAPPGGPILRRMKYLAGGHTSVQLYLCCPGPMYMVHR